MQAPPTVSVADAMGLGRRGTPELGQGLSQPSPLSPALGTPRPPGLSSPVISIDPPSSTVQQGQDASFKCLIHEGAAPISLEWKTRNQELEGKRAAGQGWRQV